MSSPQSAEYIHPLFYIKQDYIKRLFFLRVSPFLVVMKRSGLLYKHLLHYYKYNYT